MLLRHELIPEAIERIKPHGCAFQGEPCNDGMWVFTQGHGSYGTRLLSVLPGQRHAYQARALSRPPRAYAEVAAAYGALNRRLVVCADGDWKRYTGGKSDFVAEIVRLATSQIEQAA